MFRGLFQHAVDDKGRVAIPTPFLGWLAELQDERVVASKFRIGTYRCLDVYPFSAWLRLEPSLLNRFDPPYLRFRFGKVYPSGAHELAIRQGRVLLPPLLREYAGIARDVMITGDFDLFRIWDRQVFWAFVGFSPESLT
jgi:MraZ protein